MNDLEEIVYKHALLNAAKHKGSANPGAVMGSIMANEPELRSRAKEIGPLAGKIVAKVNNLSVEEQASEMEKYHVEVQEKKQVKDVGLQELPAGRDVVEQVPDREGRARRGGDLLQGDLLRSGEDDLAADFRFRLLRPSQDHQELEMKLAGTVPKETCGDCPQ